MRSTFKVVATGLLVITGCCFLSFRQKQPVIAETTRQKLALQADTFLTSVKQLQSIPLDAFNTKKLQQQFRVVRLTYKKIEWATEYFTPITTRQVNGPPVPETELSGTVIQPNGLQVIEELIFPRFRLSSKKQLNILLNSLTANAAQFKDYFTSADLQDFQILDAIKLEVFHVETLGLNDFDDPLARQCFSESATALYNLKEVAMRYAAADTEHLQDRFKLAIRYLSQPVSFNNFNRAAFLTNYANPLTRSLAGVRKKLHLPDIRYNRLLNQNAATLFDSNSFNRNAYTASIEDSATAQKIALGKKLFFDPLLSGNMTRSCSSCHHPEKAFTDGLVKNLDITGKKTIARNTPTLINAALQPAQFYDLRTASLEDQAGNVVGNVDEMHGDMHLSANKFWKNAGYRKLFSEAFPMKSRKAIDTTEILNALASYIRSLTALNSRFDAYMQGNQKSLNQTEINGFNLFMGKARCSTCHYMPLFNGTLPPRYMQMDAEVIGVPKTIAGKSIDPDEGLFAISHEGFNHHSFKVTTVRNSARTAPYMHNGVFKTLEEVINFYNKGGGVGLGFKVPNQTLLADKLNLTVKEQKELVAFIKSLDSH